MRYINIIILSLILIFINGCSTKTVQNNNITTKTQIEDIDIEEDEFLDEFEEEMKLEEVYDPFAGYNRMMTTFNDNLYEYVISPTAKGYRAITHEEVRDSVDNFFNNLLFPVRFVNNLLQGKFQNVAEETGRFLINTTVGVLGLFDPAKSYFGLKQHNEDFGQTLGVYGVGSGPHIVLPFLGPSNLRDMISMYPDSMINPIDSSNKIDYKITDEYGETLLLKAYNQVNNVAIGKDEYKILKKDAVDLYPYLRDVYEQYREKQIKE
ncbi:MAG: VacJ family lipoprotein [Campylobacterota bacterium]|nr:VacJ family lipoprotein [Campylobacterota bacterium]